jgi:predicted RNA-binding Zn-ribbon protein involved in translation (DUF1610 family)
MAVTKCLSCEQPVHLPDDWEDDHFQCPHCGIANVLSQPTRPPKRRRRREPEVTRHVHETRGASSTGFAGCFGGTLGVMAALFLVFCVLPIGFFVIVPAMKKVDEAGDRARQQNESKGSTKR